jgi:chemotaxis protein CheC
MEINDLSRLTAALQTKLSEALTNLTRQQVSLSLDKCGIVSIIKMHEWLKKPEEAITTVYIPIMGEVTGDIFVFLPIESAQALSDLMMGQPVGTTSFISEFEASALKELGNITTGVIVTEIANMLKISMMLTVPNLATDMAGALIDQVLIEYGETADQLLAFNFPFTISVQEKTIMGSFILFFDKASSDTINQKLTSPNATGGNLA